MAEEEKEEAAASRGEANFFLASKVGEESTVEAREHRGPRIQGCSGKQRYSMLCRWERANGYWHAVLMDRPTALPPLRLLVSPRNMRAERYRATKVRRWEEMHRQTGRGEEKRYCVSRVRKDDQYVGRWNGSLGDNFFFEKNFFR